MELSILFERIVLILYLTVVFSPKSCAGLVTALFTPLLVRYEFYHFVPVVHFGHMQG